MMIKIGKAKAFPIFFTSTKTEYSSAECLLNVVKLEVRALITKLFGSAGFSGDLLCFR